MPNGDASPDVLTTREVCARLGVHRHRLMDMENAGVLTRAGTVSSGVGRGVVYAVSDVEGALTRWAAIQRAKVQARRPVVERPAVPAVPPDMMTAAEVCAALSITNGTLKQYQRAGRLTPAVRQAAGNGATIRLFRRQDVDDVEMVRDYRAPQQRISAVADELASGAGLADALQGACVSRTTWNYWVRHRKDAAAVAASVRVVEDDAAEADAREVMGRVLAAFEGGAPIYEALAAQGLRRTQHSVWLSGLSSAPGASRWFAVEYNRIVNMRRSEESAERAAMAERRRVKCATSQGWVYFITSTGRTSPIKIGWTQVGVESRLDDLQVGSPVELRSLLAIPAMGAFEGWCHRQFSDDRMYGEWFKRTPRLMSFIDRLRDLGDVTDRTPAELRDMLCSPALSLFGGTHGPTP